MFKEYKTANKRKSRKRLRSDLNVGMDDPIDLLMNTVDPMDIDAVESGNPTTLDVLSENCSTHGCSHFCTSVISLNFQCVNPKCKLLWQRNCMLTIMNENQELENMHEFNHETSKICINCFIDKQLFWTYDYQHWNDIPNEDKKFK